MKNNKILYPLFRATKDSPDKILQLQKGHDSWNTTTPLFKKHFETTY